MTIYKPVLTVFASKSECLEDSFQSLGGRAWRLELRESDAGFTFEYWIERSAAMLSHEYA